MKRFLLLPAVLLLALSVRAQEGEEAPSEGEPVSEPAGDVQPPQGGAAGNAAGGGTDEPVEAEEPAEKEEPLISVKIDGASGNQERDEDSIEVAEPKKRAVPSATVMKPAKKVKKSPASDKAVKSAPVVTKGKSPVTTVPSAPAAPPPPAVPLTPITPRNP